MGLNTIRLEGKLETEEFFDLADQPGHPGDGGLVLLRFLGALAEAGSRRTLRLPSSRCAIRFTACAAIPAW